MESTGSIPTHPERCGRALWPALLFLPLAIGLLAPRQAQAQKADFLFRTPSVALNLRGGYTLARAGGDVFDFTRENLTLDRKDFGAFTIGADIGVRVAPRFDVVLGFAHSGTSARSEFRDWVELTAAGDSLPIEQRTRYSQTPLTAGFRYYLVPRGRQVGRFVWIPARVVPYIGATVGTVYYRFEQDGDWVDFQDGGIFTDELSSSGWTAVGQAVGGVEFGLTPAIALVTEGRLSVANAEPDLDFVGFDGIDLSGLQLTVGLSFRM